MNILVVIPARGGSKGIPRKNLRSLSGKPLIYYSIRTALCSSYPLDAYVSSEDNEIIGLASKMGAKIHRRDSAIAKDETTLDPVIFDTYRYASTVEKKKYDLVITVQPTSPLLKSHTLDKVIQRFQENPTLETVIAATDDTHLSWRRENERYLPNYTKRVNRQYLTPVYKETGAFLATRANVIRRENRIGENVDLYCLSGGESIDIDTYEDWNLCEYYLKRKKVLFVVSGYPEIGLGHVYNTLLLANDMLDHEVLFLVDSKSQLAGQKISLHNYHVHYQKEDSLINDILSLSPDVVVNDILDTDVQYVEALKKSGVKVVNFEDLGEGAAAADLVINAIYPENKVLPNHFFGPDFFVLRDEFVLSPQKEVLPEVKQVLLTFGGVDPENLTLKVLESIYKKCVAGGIELHIAAGFGYKNHDLLEPFTHAVIHRNSTQISDLMVAADLIFTSAGRTIYEIASLGVPAIVLAQNERESTHFFASDKYGFVNLGLGAHVDNKIIQTEFHALISNYEKRLECSRKMKQFDLRGGRKRVQRLIRSLLEA